MYGTIITWAVTPNDSRGSASSTLSFKVTTKRKSLLSLARLVVDGAGIAVRELIDSGDIIPAKHNRDGHKVAGWGGVTIQYPSGLVREVREA